MHPFGLDSLWVYAKFITKTKYAFIPITLCDHKYLRVWIWCAILIQFVCLWPEFKVGKKTNVQKI